eukprot:Rmarinus@m.28950
MEAELQEINIDEITTSSFDSRFKGAERVATASPAKSPSPDLVIKPGPSPDRTVKRKEVEESLDVRTIHINDAAANAFSKFPNNYVSTTKYTPLLFLPKNLLEQFRRIANIWFLLISLLQMFSGVSPTGKYNTVQALLIVLATSAIKEAWEDIKRYKQDREVNYRTTKVLRGGEFLECFWRDLQTGDIVRMESGEFVPCDLVCLSTSESTGVGYVETAGLDGETNLKQKQSLDETSKFVSPTQLQLLSGTIVCEVPNDRLYKFDGKINLAKLTLRVTPNQVYLRGSVLRNTKWVIGVVVYAGRDTKLMQNATDTPSKQSSLERMVNRLLLVMFTLNI